MPQLIKNIQGDILQNITSEVIFVKNVTGILQQEDYIDLFGFNAYLQDLKQTEFTEALTVPNLFGLPNTSNLKMITIEIDY
jgi:hypothetical protein